MTDSFVGPDGVVYEVVDDDEDDFDLDEPLTRADFRAWVEAQQGQEYDDEYDDEEELTDEEEAYWDDLVQHVEAYENWRGNLMTTRELETFKQRFDNTPPDQLVDTEGFYDQNNDRSDKSALHLAETMEDLQAEQETEGEEGEAEDA